jgi:DNA-binding transcriptional ArsR family regulator
LVFGPWFFIVRRRDVFQAIADPTRREIISLLAKKTYNLNSVVQRFDVSRPAIAKHLKILSQCGLVEVRQDGREKFYEAKLEGLREVSQWSEQYRDFWSKKLDALGTYLMTDSKSKDKSIKGKSAKAKSKKK